MNFLSKKNQIGNFLNMKNNLLFFNIILCAERKKCLNSVIKN